MTERKLTLAWLALITLTMSGSLMGEYAQPGFWVTLVLATVTLLKGQWLIDQFMDLNAAAPAVRRTVKAFGFLVPMLMLLIYAITR